MILVIDNYDSFTFNLVQCMGELGADPVVKRNDDPAVLLNGPASPEKIVISPGPGRPGDSGLCPEVIRKFAGKVPILGVCLGHQCIAEVFGASVRRAGRIVHGKTSRVWHDGRAVYRNLSNPFVATRYHSLIVDEESVPACLEITSHTSEGEVMGLRHREMAVEGVQFHPESVLTEEGRTLLRNFLEV